MSSPLRPLLVTAAIIKDGDHYLIAQRKADSPIEPNKWEFPGGKVEHGEHPEAGLCREIKEELGLDVGVCEFYDLVSHIYSHPRGNIHIVLLFYICELRGGTLQALDVQDCRWILREEFAHYIFADADVPVVRRIFANSNE